MIERRPLAELGRRRTRLARHPLPLLLRGVPRPRRMGWGTLRVWNDDEIAPGRGLSAHPHADMEIITYVRQGAVTHQDSLGNEGRTSAGDVQVMSAGTGIRHAEYNRETSRPGCSRSGSANLAAAARPAGAPSRFRRTTALAGSWRWRAAMRPMRTRCRSAPSAGLGATLKRASATYALAPGRHAYLVPASGAIEINGVPLDGRATAPRSVTKPNCASQLSKTANWCLSTVHDRGRVRGVMGRLSSASRI